MTGEQTDGVTLVWCLFLAGLLILAGRWLFGRLLKRSRPPDPTTTPFETVLASVLAYGCYVSAALEINARFPQFLRDHLFDGLALAGLAGFLVHRFPRGDPYRVLMPIIRRPILILFVFFLIGGLVFGLIAAAVVFTSGSDDFAGPVWRCAVVGGLIPAFAYGLVILDYSYWVPRTDASEVGPVKWWFRKRPDGERSSTGDSADRTTPEFVPKDTAVPIADNILGEAANATADVRHPRQEPR
jgi:hypothetical protein